jgi:drug/metabolite transporter (DMT)-like permease
MYFLYNWSISVLGASRAGTLVYTQMLFATFFAWTILGERIEWYHYVAGSLVIVGILLVTLLRPQPTARA